MCQCHILIYQGITLVGLDGDHALGATHLQCGIGNVDDRYKLQEERSSEDAVIPDVEAGHLERQYLLALVVPCSTKHLQVDASDGSGRLLWDNPMKLIMYGGQVFQIEAHLDEGFPHDKIQ
jgi:hypothetical protein